MEELFCSAGTQNSSVFPKIFVFCENLFIEMFLAVNK